MKENRMQITEAARRAAAIAVAVEVNGWPVDASLPYHPTDPTVADTMRRITDVALEAALPHLAPQPVVDRETLLIEMNEAAERNDFGKFLEDDDFEALTRAVEKVARPMPTREQFADATHDFDHAHSWRDERFCPQYACLEVYLPRTDAVLALLNGTAK